MIEKLFKSFTIRIAAGVIILLVILFGLFLSGRKPSQSSIQDTETPVAMKIPKLNSTVEPPVNKISAEIPPSEMIQEKTIEEKLPKQDETLLNLEDPFFSEKEDITASIPVDKTPEGGVRTVSISAHETSEAGENAESTLVHETEEFPDMEAEGEVAEEESVEENDLKILEETEAEKPEVKEQAEAETVTTEKKPYTSEFEGKRIIRDVILLKSGSEQKLVFQTESPIIQYKYFILSNPPRLVVDLPGVWKDPDFLEKRVDSSLISRIRLWNHGDKLRIVNDLKSDKALFPVFTRSSDGVEAVLKTR